MRTRFAVILCLLSLTALADQPLSYVFKHGGTSHLRANGSIETAVRIAKKWDGDFIWVRDEGREYLIRDTNVIAQASDVMRELEAFEPAVRAAEKKVRPYEEQLDEIERRSDDLSDALDDEDLADSRREALEAKLHEVDQQMHELESRMHDAEEELEAAEREMESHEEGVERRLEQIIQRAIRNGSANRIAN